MGGISTAPDSAGFIQCTQLCHRADTDDDLAVYVVHRSWHSAVRHSVCTLVSQCDWTEVCVCWFDDCGRCITDWHDSQIEAEQEFQITR